MTLTPEDIITYSGPRWIASLLSERLEEFLSAGGRLYATKTGFLWAVVRDGRAYPVVCSELVVIGTEDGPIDGRCGVPVAGGALTGLCEGHGAVVSHWRQMDELERREWELLEDRR